MKSVAGIIYLVKDLERTITFYEKLGFEFRKRVLDVSATAYLNWFWIEFLLESKVVTEEFKEDIDITHKGAGQYIHISVEDVDKFYSAVVSKGLRPAREPQDYPWGNREFVIRDPDGYKLVFFQRK